jgi:hypothetical protein
MSVNRADIVAVFGASGSGKSSYIKQRLRREKPARLLIWDPQSEYAEFGQVFSKTGAALDCVLEARRGRFAVVYQPVGSLESWRRQFDFLCRMAYEAGHVFMVAEELADVTTASWAPEGWSMATRKGRHTGMRIIGASQRPASIDKHFFGNATTIRTGRLNFEADIKVLANVTGESPDTIRGLMPLEWIEKSMQDGKISRGAIRF